MGNKKRKESEKLKTSSKLDKNKKKKSTRSRKLRKPWFPQDNDGGHDDLLCPVCWKTVMNVDEIEKHIFEFECPLVIEILKIAPKKRRPALSLHQIFTKKPMPKKIMGSGPIFPKKPIS